MGTNRSSARIRRAMASKRYTTPEANRRANLNAAVRSRESALLDDHEPVAVGVAEKEHRRDRGAHPRHL